MRPAPPSFVPTLVVTVWILAVAAVLANQAGLGWPVALLVGFASLQPLIVTRPTVGLAKNDA